MVTINTIDKENICAIIITYNGKQTLSSTIEHVIKKVNHVVIVDNYSTDGTREYLDIIKSSSLTVIHNEKNYGIAQALNRGVEHAEKNGFHWVLTMDQDSVISENMIDEMVKVYSKLTERERSITASLSPRVVYKDKDFIKKSNTSKPYYEKTAVITSGNLVKTAAIKEVGGYEEKLFIDSVDFDFCLRLKKRGLKILLCNNATMFHSLGETVEKRLLGIKISIHLHSKIRKYYISRNHAYIIREYFLNNIRFCIKKNISFCGFILQTIAYEKNILDNLKIILEGIADGIKGNYGEKIDLDNK